MKEIIVRNLEPADYQEWDSFVDRIPQGTVFHKSTWVSAISQALNQRFSIFGCFENERLVGGYVLYHTRYMGFFRSTKSTAMMSSFGGLIVDGGSNMNCFKREKQHCAIIGAVLRDLRSRRFHYVLFELSPSYLDIRPFIWNGWRTNTRYSYVISPGKAFFSKSARRHIRRAVEGDVFIEQTTDSESYYELFCNTYARQGISPPLTHGQFVRLYHTIEGAGLSRMWAARTSEGEWAAAEIHLKDEKRTYAWSAASDIELRKSGANYLLQETIFSQEASDGFEESYLFTANTPNLANFMKQFGPELALYHQVSYSQIRMNRFNHPQRSG